MIANIFTFQVLLTPHARTDQQIVRRRSVPDPPLHHLAEDDVVQLRRKVIRLTGGVHDMVGFFSLSQFSPCSISEWLVYENYACLLH